MSEEWTLGPLNILGIPYSVEFTDLPDPDDANCDRMIHRDPAVIRLQTSTTTVYAKRSLFGAVVREAVQILPVGRDFDWDQERAFAYTYFGVLRTNPQALAFCAGWTDGVPEVVEVAGTPWTIHLVDHCPGYDKNTFGLTVYRDQAIYLRQELNLPLMRAVLIHELGHAVADAAAPVLRDDELFMRAFHVTLSAVLRDNPDLCRQLFA